MGINAKIIELISKIQDESFDMPQYNKTKVFSSLSKSLLALLDNLIEYIYKTHILEDDKNEEQDLQMPNNNIKNEVSMGKNVLKFFKEKILKNIFLSDKYDSYSDDYSDFKTFYPIEQNPILFTKSDLPAADVTIGHLPLKNILTSELNYKIPDFHPNWFDDSFSQLGKLLKFSFGDLNMMGNLTNVLTFENEKSDIKNLVTSNLVSNEYSGADVPAFSSGNTINNVNNTQNINGVNISIDTKNTNPTEIAKTVRQEFLEILEDFRTDAGML